MTKNIEEIFDKLLSDMGVSYYAHFIKSEGTNSKFEVILSRNCPDESKQGNTSYIFYSNREFPTAFEFFSNIYIFQPEMDLYTFALEMGLEYDIYNPDQKKEVEQSFSRAWNEYRKTIKFFSGEGEIRKIQDAVINR